MNLISFKRKEDYGTELYVQVLHNKRWALLQASVSWNEYAGWPYIQIKSGTGSLLSIIFWCWKIGFDIGICERSWNWEYMKDLNVKENELNYD